MLHLRILAQRKQLAMLSEGYIVEKMRYRRTRRVFALILLAVLTILCVLNLPKKQVSARQAPVIQPSFLTSQSNKADSKASQLDNQAQELYEAGQFAEAVKVWQKAQEAYDQIGDADGITKSRINMTQALQALGLYPTACNTLLQAFNIADLDCRDLSESNANKQDSLIKTLEQLPNSQISVVALRGLGNVLQKVDNLPLSQQVLQLSLNAAKALNLPEDESAALLSLGNTFQAWGDRTRASQSQDIQNKLPSTPWRCLYSSSLGVPRKFYQQADAFYQQAATEPVSTTTWIQAQINRLNVLLETNALSEAQGLWPQIKSRLDTLPASRIAAYTQLKLASSLTCLKQANADNAPSWTEIAQTLATTARLAHRFGDQRTESYATGYLGGLYAQTQQNAQNLRYAQNLTQQALTLAQAIRATDIAYLWQWQLGYLRKTQGDNKGAIAAYTEAVNSLHSIRSDLSAASRNIQFSFTERVEPVYRQLVDLLLQSEQPDQKDLKKAQDVIKALQVAELENLLRCNLQATSPVSIERDVDPTAAVIYPIILDERIEVILSLSGQPLRHYSHSLPEEQNIEDLLQTLRQNLQTPNTTKRGFLKSSQLVYDWLLRPVETDLARSGVKTLVFVLDGALRQIPMAALHDGQHYLIEKYAVALSPSLQLLQPKPLQDIHLEVLAAGISQKIPGFAGAALPEVKGELEQISELTTSVVLSNREFTRQALQAKLNERPFSIVHLATHGQFSSNPNQTYIRAWDERIDVNQLRNLLQTREISRAEAIELLVLSACDTASSDRRAALGLAGVAVRAGERSTLASLWQVRDDSTASLMANFYKTLSKSDSTTTKAQALQSAQLELLHHNSAPFQWAGYVLVGNWL